MKPNREIERLDQAEITNLQNEALRKQIAFITENSTFYQRMFRERDIDPKSIRTTKDLKQLPFTSKADLQEFHQDFISVDARSIIDYSSTSGTLGKPVIIPQTENDLQRLAYNEMKSLMCTGGTKNDTYLLTTTINKQFMAGLAYFLGVRKLGAGIIRVGSGAIPLQWQNILSLKPTALIVVPSFLARMIDYAKANGIDYKKTSVRSAICIGEPLRNVDFTLNALGNRIQRDWDLDMYSTYASTEMATAFTECEEKKGGHLQPDLIVAELVDDNGNEVPDGTPGELVVTPLGIEAFPLLRFKTGDICTKHTEKCACGRNTFRLGPVIGRKNHMIKYKGTTVYPPAIFDILDSFQWISHYQVQLMNDELGNDKLVLNINQCNLADLKELKTKLSSLLRVTPDVVQMAASQINNMIYKETLRKPVKFLDLRQ